MIIKKHASILCSLAGLAAVTTPVYSQGLLGIGGNADFNDEIPFQITVGSEFGYDRTKYSGSDDAVSSTFLRGGIGLAYGKKTPTTQYDITADIGVLRYFDEVPGVEDTNYTGRFAFNIAHSFSPRLSVNNNFYVTYEVEPNYSIGAVTGQRGEPYIYGYENFALSYAWSKRFSTTSSYTFSGVYYDDAIESHDNRATHTFAQEVKYSLSEITKLIGEYRFSYTKFERATDLDAYSHFLLVGIETALSKRLQVSARGGVELRETDRNGSDMAPYIEAALRYAVNRDTSVRWYHSLGFDNNDIGASANRYTYRTGITGSHQFSEKLTGTAGINYAFSKFEGNNGQGDSGNATEHDVDANIGVAYRLFKNVNLTASYAYTVVNTKDKERDSNRQRIAVGVNATF